MADGITIAALSMINDMQHMNNISQNITNALTPGYKRSTPFNVVMSTLQTGNGKSSFSAPLPTAAAMLDMKQGTVRQTGNPLDLAIDGNGFFEIQSNDKTYYTRQGQFTLDNNGMLVTSTGEAVAGLSGTLRLSSDKPAIDRQGMVLENGKPAGQIKIVQFTDNSLLQYVGEGKYVQASASIKPQEKASLRQGQLETSNVNSTVEMVRMIETMRHFESGQKIIQMYDEMNERLITKLGEF